MLKTNAALQVLVNNVDERTADRGYVLKLLKDYQKLSRDTNEENRLESEVLKLEHIKLIECNLKRDLYLLPARGISVAVQPPQYRKKLYYSLMILGTLNDAARNYMFGSALISLIPNLAQPLRIILSILYIVFEAILFYGFEIALLKDALAISNTSTNLSSYINTNIEQVRTVTRINQLLVHIQVLDMDDKQYQDYHSLVAVLNADLHTKLHSLQSYEAPWYKKTFKVAVLGFGVITNIASSYFLFNAVLTTWAATLVGTPLGWGVIILAIVVELGFYYAMGAASILRLLNSDSDHFNVLKNELSMFEQDHLLFFSKHVKKQEINLSHRMVHDRATQTEPHMH